MQKNEKELEKAIRIYSDDVGMEFGAEKCAMIIMKSRKRKMMEGMKLQNQEKIRTLGKKKLVDKFTYLGSSVSSIKNDINTRRAAVVSILLYGCTT